MLIFLLYLGERTIKILQDEQLKVYEFVDDATKNDGDKNWQRMIGFFGGSNGGWVSWSVGPCPAQMVLIPMRKMVSGETIDDSMCNRQMVTNGD